MECPKKYLAGWVPRFLRQTKLAYLPTTSVICTQTVQDGDGKNHYTDLIMLPVKEFKRMQSYIGLQHILAPVPNMGKAFDPVFSVKSAKQVTVPKDHQDAEAYARAYFLIEFGVLKPDKIALKKD